MTSTGSLYTCLGHEETVNLRPLLRGGESDQGIDAAIDAAIKRKPRGSTFTPDSVANAVIARHMNVTGG